MTNQNKCIVIGAAGGIGRSLAMQLAADGCSLVLAGRNRGPLTDLASTLGDAVRDVAEVDAQDFDAVNSLFGEHPDANGAVNLAGSIILKPAHSTSSDDFDATIAQNLRTAFAVTRAAGRAMRKSGGSVVLVSTCAAQIGLPNHEAISAAKAGVEGLVRSAAATYATAGLRFNAVAPGLTRTPLADPITRNEASRKASEAMHPLGRLGDPEEVARVIAFLLSPQNTWITGQVIGVDGGMARVKGR